MKNVLAFGRMVLVVSAALVIANYVITPLIDKAITAVKGK